MVRPSAHGRPGTRVVPTRWESDHAPVAAGAATATCTIHKPAVTPIANSDLSYTAGSPTLVHSGSCRVQAWTGNTAPTLGDQRLERSTYLVQLEQDVSGVSTGDTVTIATCDDPDLVGETLTVKLSLSGSLRFSRDLLCVLDREV